MAESVPSGPATPTVPVPDKPWYYRSGTVTLFLFLCFPVGLWLMWSGKAYPVAVRVIVSVLFGLVIVSNVNGKPVQQVSPASSAAQNPRIAEPVQQVAQPPAAKAPEERTPFATNIKGFEAAIPLLKKVGCAETIDANGWANFSWANLSTNGANHFILKDSDHDKTPESGTLILAVKTGDQMSHLEAAALTLKSISTASGDEIDPKAFADWFFTVARESKAQPKRFGTVIAYPRRIAAPDGSIIMIGLNQK